MHLLTGAGRVGRLQYVTLSLVVVVTLLLAAFASIGTDELTGEIRASPLFLVVAVLGVWLANANVVRRLHDCGHSGWLALLGLVPIVSVGLGYYLLATAGDDRPNRYGPPPGQRRAPAPARHRQRMHQLTASAPEAHTAQHQGRRGAPGQSSSRPTSRSSPAVNVRSIIESSER